MMLLKSLDIRMPPSTNFSAESVRKLRAGQEAELRCNVFTRALQGIQAPTHIPSLDLIRAIKVSFELEFWASVSFISEILPHTTPCRW